RAAAMRAATDAEGKADPLADLVFAAGEYLELSSGEVSVVRVAAVDFATEREPVSEIVQDGNAAGDDVAARASYAHISGAGVAGEEVAEVAIDSRLFRERFLRDQVQPVVHQAGSELVVGISCRNFEVEACAERRRARTFRLLMKFPFHAQIGIAVA